MSTSVKRKKIAKKTKMAVHHGSKTMVFETDPELFAELHKEFKFDIDLYASKENKLRSLFFSEKNPAEANDWSRKSKKGAKAGAYGNPPYGRGLFKRLEYAVDQAKGMRVVVLLLPARTDTKWFRLLAQHAVINLLPSRLSFYLHGEPMQVWSKKNNRFEHQKAPFPSLIAVLGHCVRMPCIRVYEGGRYLPGKFRQ